MKILVASSLLLVACGTAEEKPQEPAVEMEETVVAKPAPLAVMTPTPLPPFVIESDYPSEEEMEAWRQAREAKCLREDRQLWCRQNRITLCSNGAEMWCLNVVNRDFSSWLASF
jgi:hypothetical protein